MRNENDFDSSGQFDFFIIIVFFVFFHRRIFNCWRFVFHRYVHIGDGNNLKWFDFLSIEEKMSRCFTCPLVNSVLLVLSTEDSTESRWIGIWNRSKTFLKISFFTLNHFVSLRFEQRQTNEWFSKRIKKKKQNNVKSKKRCSDSNVDVRWSPNEENRVFF